MEPPPPPPSSSSSSSSSSCPSPADSAGFFSRWSYSYVRKLMDVGAKATLEPFHLPPLGKHDDIYHVTRRIKQKWDEAVEKHRKKSTHGAASVKLPKNTLFWTLLRAHRTEVIIGGIFALGESSAFIVQPILLKFFVDWLRDEDEGPALGYILAVLIGLASVYQTFVHHVLYFFTMRLGWNLRIGIIGLVHEKLLSLNSASVARFSTGTVINLISTDVLRFDTFSPSLHFVWTTVVEIVVCTGLIVSQVGWAAGMSGIGVLVLSIVIITMLGRNFAKLRRRTARATDKRVKLTAEVLGAMLSVKAYTWEDAFTHNIAKLRESEAASILRAQRLRATNASMYFAATALAALVTFVVVWAQKRLLDTSDVVFVLGLLQVLRIGIGKKFTRWMESGPECFVAVHRMQRFFELTADEGLAYPSSLPPHGSNSSTPSHPVTREKEELKAHANSASEGALAQRQQEELAQPTGRCYINITNATIAWPPSRDDVVTSPTKSTTKKRESNGMEAPSSLATQSRVPASSNASNPSDSTSTSQSTPILADVNLHVQKPGLISISGPVGSGKSTLLAALTSEAIITKGSLDFSDVAFAAQDAWIFPGSLRSNIIFSSNDDLSSSVDEEWYRHVISACSLERDIELLPDGEATEIGEKGVNLSGGQQARIGLARCMYARRSICLLDDPLAAVDPHVAEQLMSGAIAEMRTRSIVVLVTHHPHFAVQADQIFVIDDGKLVPHTKEQFKLTASQYIGENSATNAIAFKAVDDAHASDEANSQAMDADPADEGTTKKIKRRASKLVIEEDRQKGVVTFATYWRYFTSSGLFLSLYVLFSFFLSQGLLFATDYWLQRWSKLSFDNQQRSSNVYTYVALAVATMVSALLGSMLFFYAITKSNSNLHISALSSVLNAPLGFFSANPLGRILNRFSSDLGQIDELLPRITFDTTQLLVMCIGSVVFACVAIPYLAIGIPPLFYVLYRIRVFAVSSLRDLKRLDGTSRSPVYEMFSTSIAGLQSIRAYNMQGPIQIKFLHLLQKNATAWFWWLLVNRWLGFRLDLLSALVAVMGCVIGAALKGRVDDGVLGIALVYVIALSGVFQYMVRLSAQVETLMTSVERIQHYIHSIPQEGEYFARLSHDGGGDDDDDRDGGSASLAPTKSQSHQAAHGLRRRGESHQLDAYAKWPPSATIKAVDLCARYREDSVDVLHSLSFDIPSGSKVGLMGRTGSGKSSFSQALIGTVITSGGHIDIGGTNTLDVPTKVVRSCISFIPQEPRLFSSTVRFNLDPSQTKPELELQNALEAVQLAKSLTLDSPIDSNGGNLSVGQRQLLSLARAMLVKAPIVLMDEATANIDYDTDSIIQQTLRSHPSFRHATLIVIAHRLQTIADANMIIQLDAGNVVDIQYREGDDPGPGDYQPYTPSLSSENQTRNTLQRHLGDVHMSISVV